MESDVAIERLQREIDQSTSFNNLGEPPTLASNIHDVITRGLNTDDNVSDAVLKTSSTEALIAMLAFSNGPANGNEMNEMMEEYFGARLSTGLLYSRLDDIQSSGLFEKREQIQTKDYTVKQPEDARKRLKTTADDHLHFALHLYSAAERLS